MPEQLIFSKNNLIQIASDEGYPYVPGMDIRTIDGEVSQKSPDWNKGQLYFATKDDDNASSMTINGKTVSVGHHKVYIYLDDNDTQKRYYVTSPITWSEVLEKPLDKILSDLSVAPLAADSHNLQLHYLDDVTSVKKSVKLPFVLLSGDTMTGALTIARNNSTTSPRVSLDYNDTTDSLDFIFT